MAQKAKSKTLYDENNRWVEERNRIKGAIRRAFRLSPQMKEALTKARHELPPLPIKDGSPGKKIRVRFQCSICKELFSSKQVQVDHITPVVPLWKKEKDMSYDEIVRGVFCNVDNLQILCSIPMKKNNGKPSCHKKKTDKENWIRNQIDKDKPSSDGTDWDQIIKDYERYYEAHLLEKEDKKTKKNVRRKKDNNKRR